MAGGDRRHRFAMPNGPARREWLTCGGGLAIDSSATPLMKCAQRPPAQSMPVGRLETRLPALCRGDANRRW